MSKKWALLIGIQFAAIVILAFGFNKKSTELGKIHYDLTLAKQEASAQREIAMQSAANAARAQYEAEKQAALAVAMIGSPGNGKPSKRTYTSEELKEVSALAAEAQLDAKRSAAAASEQAKMAQAEARVAAEMAEKQARLAKNAQEEAENQRKLVLDLERKLTDCQNGNENE